MQSISVFNSEVLKEIEQLNLFDFGIYLELEPEEEDIAQLEQNIQIALKTGNIDLDDVIDIREIKNIKLANEVLKIRKKKKQEAAQQAQLANIQAQSQANTQAAEQSALAELQKQQALTQEKVNIEQAKSQFEIQRLQAEAQIKKELMAQEFEYQMQLAQVRAKAETEKEQEIEDRKDKRIRMQGTQQSELIDQRKNDTLPKDFESAGNDTLGGFSLEAFSPK
jgi:multidrug efflux pump subunit AcrA (membrane-fusion protein)